MRRLLLCVVLALALFLTAMPVVGQTTADLVDALIADGRFTTFVAALDAADMSNSLRQPGFVTVFAPTDAAFEAAFTVAGTTPDALFASPERVRALVMAHLSNGAAAPSVVNGEILIAAQDGSTIRLTRTAAGQFVNTTVPMLPTEVPASNGVIYPIAAVLLPDVLMFIPQVVPTMVVAPAQLRLAHFSPDMPPVDFYLNGEPSSNAALEPGRFSDWLQLTPGGYELALVPQGATPAEALFGPLGLTLLPGSWTTAVIIGSAQGDTLTVAFLDEDVETTLVAGNARLTVFHAMEGVSSIDIRLSDSLVLLDGIGYGEYATIDLPEAEYDIQIVASGTTGPILTTVPAVALDDQTYTLLGVDGTALAPTTALEIVPGETIYNLLAANAAVVPALIAGQGDLVSTLESDGRFTVLISLIRAGGIEALLRAPGNFTLFAPTDAAFATLPDGALEGLLANPVSATNVLLYHLLAETIPADTLSSASSVPTILGPTITLSLTNGVLTLNATALVVEPDLIASNGVIHAIDFVLTPGA